MVVDELRLLPVVVGKEDDWYTETGFADLFREPRGMHIVDVQRHDDQVEPVLFVQKRKGLLTAGRMGEIGGVAQFEPRVFLPDLLVQSPVLFKDVIVVEGRDEEDVADAEPHEVLEPL